MGNHCIQGSKTASLKSWKFRVNVRTLEMVTNFTKIRMVNSPVMHLNLAYGSVIPGTLALWRKSDLMAYAQGG